MKSEIGTGCSSPFLLHSVATILFLTYHTAGGAVQKLIVSEGQPGDEEGMSRASCLLLWCPFWMKPNTMICAPPVRGQRRKPKQQQKKCSTEYAKHRERAFKLGGCSWKARISPPIDTSIAPDRVRRTLAMQSFLLGVFLPKRWYPSSCPFPL